MKEKPAAAPIAIMSVALGAPVLLAGGVHAAVQLGLLVGYSGLALGAFAGKLGKRPTLWHPILAFTAGLAVLSLLQTIPLPVSWVQVLSPEAADSTIAVDRVFGVQTSATMLSLDVEATREAAGRWWAVTLALCVVLQGLRTRVGRSAVPLIIAGLGAVVLAVAVFQNLMGWDRVYGLVAPRHTGADIAFSGPFIGRNHCAHFLLLCASVCLALLADSRSGRRSLLVLLFAACVLGILANGSRGALAAIAVGCVWVFFTVPARERSAGRRRLVLAVAVGFSLSAVLSLSAPRVRELLNLDNADEQADFAKLELQALGLQVLGDYPLTGAGADAFGAVQVTSGAVDAGGPHHASFVENDYLQLGVDFGLIAPVALLVVTLLLARTGRRTRLRRRPAVEWVIVIPFALYAAVSFAGPVPGLLIPALALFLARPLRPRQVTLSASRSIGLVLVIGGITAACLLVHPSLGGAEAPDDAESVREWVRSRPLDGRRLFAGAAHAQRLQLPAAVSEKLVDLASSHAGNDAPLMEAIARYYWRSDQRAQAWSLLETVSRQDGPRINRAREWVGQVTSPEELATVCRAHPDLAEVVLGALHRERRFGDLLHVALALDGDPALYYATIAAHGLQEQVLAELFADQLLAQRAADATACLRRAEAQRLVGRRTVGMEVLEECRARWPRQADLMVTALSWALSSQDEGVMDRAELERAFRQLNRVAEPGSTVRREYWRLLAVHQAREGRCAAAQLSLAQTRVGEGPTAAVQEWVREACPALPR